ncbi:MAG: nucleotidyltransferase substrate binding protein [Bdellovibrionales bacterium]|nr:nucleotidyltransferase substrate binding protein [Bdellovibrionales bacterium]
MKKEKISVQPLERALQSLERAVQQPKNEFNRDSVVQRFEYTFELCWKVLKKVIEADRPLQDQSVRSILREAHVEGLVSDVELWFEFQKARNLTSHTYNEDVAEEVYLTAVKLPVEAQALIAKLKNRLSSS